MNKLFFDTTNAEMMELVDIADLQVIDYQLIVECILYESLDVESR